MEQCDGRLGILGEALSAKLHPTQVHNMFCAFLIFFLDILPGNVCQILATVQTDDPKMEKRNRMKYQHNEAQIDQKKRMLRNLLFQFSRPRGGYKSWGTIKYEFLASPVFE